MALQRKVKWFFTLVVLANLVIVLMVILGALGPGPPKPLPNPNGYDDFVKAGNLVSGNTGDYSAMKPAELAAFVATKADALKLLRAGLNKECQTPNDYSLKYFDKALTDFANQRKLAQNLAAEGRLATLQGRTNDAAQSYLDASRFGVQCCRGGFMVSKLVGIAIEATGRRGLYSLMDGASSRECLKIAQALEVMNAQESPLADVMEQQRLCTQRGATLRQKIILLIDYKQQRKMKNNFISKFKSNQLQRRQMMLDFAARAYQLEKGKPPASINNLVPDYLKSIPQDPVTGSNLVLSIIQPQ